MLIYTITVSAMTIRADSTYPLGESFSVNYSICAPRAYDACREALTQAKLVCNWGPNQLMGPVYLERFMTVRCPSCADYKRIVAVPEDFTKERIMKDFFGTLIDFIQRACIQSPEPDEVP
ncbi:hypothetical protein [Eilatimonas milleporae]|uniref:Uncharacterized protein n=1 Tax=Eilatimonas milleporae TaxID=911205 RepID=A0A3M0CJT6_9PROT|nr:hypothetical protein [Eilatimonas milleporae]RMB09037.1 hypothetical protein BXY39_1685 [Eilatimonas milleporae]